jgi:hypothetical protein
VLVGATAGMALRRDMAARIIAPLAILGGIVTEVTVIQRGATDVQGLIPVAVIAGVAGAAVLAAKLPAKARGAVLAVALGALLVAPASWSAQTLGHAASGTFPAGGPTSEGFGGGGGPGGGMRGGPGGGMRGGFGGPNGAAPPVPGGAQGGGSSASGQSAPPAGFSVGGGTAGPPGGAQGGGGFGGGGGRMGDNVDLSAALAYAGAHGGGTIGVSSQQGAEAAIMQSGAKVAGLGGFSGRESQVSAQWLAQAVKDGRIRYVVTNGASGGMANDSRVGANDLMTIVQKVGKKTTVAGMYDLQGQSAAILAAAG